MSSNSFQRLSFLVVLLALAVLASQMDWQGAGNMSKPNMTEIQAQINNNPIRSSTTKLQMNIAQIISTELTRLWDPAWNMVIVKSIEPYDTILYAYAYKDQWMWINGIPIPTTSNILTYIIWKDYSCS